MAFLDYNFILFKHFNCPLSISKQNFQCVIRSILNTSQLLIKCDFFNVSIQKIQFHLKSTLEIFFFFKFFLMMFANMKTGAIQKRPSTKRPFTKAEDEILQKLVQQSEIPDWSQIAKQIPGRNSRQCRERWQNYIDPSINQQQWTEDEDKLLLKKYQELGPSWSMISRFFNGRTGNTVRNRYLKLTRIKVRSSRQQTASKQEPVKESKVIYQKPQNIIHNEVFALSLDCLLNRKPLFVPHSLKDFLC